MTLRIALAAVVALIMLPTAGCAPALIGAGAAGGYYVGKDERSVGEIAEDTATTARVNAEYARDEVVSAWAVNVDTFRGNVTLYGNVPSREAAERAVRLAQGVKGVKQVDSKLNVVPERQ
jgi:hyperosmotically inducible periplasmic protein